jgi:bifunctional DNA-binding transcriptional regulator/antitoxin component of YhaV-PrlF toxin-antitoxin module
MSETIHLRKRGVLTLPKRLRESYDLHEGDALHLIDLGGVFALTPLRPVVPALAREIERRRSFEEHYAGDVARFAQEAFAVCETEDGRWEWLERRVHARPARCLVSAFKTVSTKRINQMKDAPGGYCEGVTPCCSRKRFEK